jgi:hypothetical protein
MCQVARTGSIVGAAVIARTGSPLRESPAETAAGYVLSFVPPRSGLDVLDGLISLVLYIVTAGGELISHRSREGALQRRTMWGLRGPGQQRREVFAATSTCLGHRVVDVAFDGAHRDRQSCGDVAVGQA